MSPFRPSECFGLLTESGAAPGASLLRVPAQFGQFGLVDQEARRSEIGGRNGVSTAFTGQK